MKRKLCLSLMKKAYLHISLAKSLLDCIKVNSKMINKMALGKTKQEQLPCVNLL